MEFLSKKLGLNLTSSDVNVKSVNITYEEVKKKMKDEPDKNVPIDTRLISHRNTVMCTQVFNTVELTVKNPFKFELVTFASILLSINLFFFYNIKYMSLLLLLCFILTNIKNISLIFNYYYLGFLPFLYINVYLTLLIFTVIIAAVLYSKYNYIRNSCSLTYVPHLITFLYSQFSKGVSELVYRETAKQKLRTLTSFPLPADMFFDLYEGSMEIGLYLIQDTDFFIQGSRDTEGTRHGILSLGPYSCYLDSLTYVVQEVSTNMLLTFITQITKSMCCLPELVKSIYLWLHRTCLKKISHVRIIELQEKLRTV